MNTTRKDVEKAISLILNVLDSCVGTINPEKVKISLSILASRIKELEQRDQWKTVEVDGMPKDGLYVGKFDDHDGTDWKHLILKVKNQRWEYKNLAFPNGPNYYREATPREFGE